MTRRTALATVSAMLTAGTLAKADEPPINWFDPDGTINWEAERQQRRIPIDTVVIHHTAGQSGATLMSLSNLELKRIYEPFFVQGSKGDPEIAPGSPVWSGHWAIMDDRLVPSFTIYHFLIKQDGAREQHMPIRYVGWHAGNWQVNNQSIGIVLDGNFEQQAPPEAMLRGIASLLVYLKIVEALPIEYVVGHKNVRKADTTCPGPWFFHGGRETILEYVNAAAGRKLGISFTHPLAVR